VVIFSRFVLEHIKPNDLLEIHKHIYENTPQSTRVLHLISPSDHRSYEDNSLSTYDFLKYSEAEWNEIQTKFDYHNRLRLPQYLKIFEDSNFKIEYLKYDQVNTESAKYRKFKQLMLHKDFKHFTEEEILASSIVLLLSKS
jgi:hypothetical protein